MEIRNTIVISGKIETIEAVRFTPAGLTVLQFTIQHESVQQEAKLPKKIQATFYCMLIGEELSQLNQIKQHMQIKVKGFMAAQSAKARYKLVLHVKNYELIH